MKNDINKAVFLDRDGTIMSDVGYCSSVNQVHIYPYSAMAINLFQQMGYKVIIITNQSGIGRGMFSIGRLRTIHEFIKTSMLLSGTILDAIYYCPHIPDNMCLCRKPSPGMIFAAESDHRLTLSLSYFIGDKYTDIESAFRSGCNPILIEGQGSEFESEDKDCTRVPTFNNLLEAALWVKDTHLKGSLFNNILLN